MKIPTIEWHKEPNVVLLLGSEEYFKDQLVQQAQKALGSYQHKLLWAGIDSDAQIKNHLYEGSFIPVQKLIIIRDANKVSSEDTIKAYCERPESNNVVVLVSSEGRKPKWFTSLKCNQKVTCDKPKPWEIKNWVTHFCNTRGYTISSNLAEALHANVGDDLYALANELEKVFLNMKEGTSQIEPAHITSVLVQHKALSPFKVVEAWCTQDVKHALRMGSIYFQQSSDSYAAIPLIATLLNQIERMIHFESMKTCEFKKKDICKRMGISSYVYDQLDKQVLHWSLVELRKAYLQMCEVEAQAKRGGSGELLVNWFLGQDYS